MKELVKYLARAIVDRPDEVEVTEVEGDRTSIIKLRVAKRGFRLNYREAREERRGHQNHPQGIRGKAGEKAHPGDY